MTTTYAELCDFNKAVSFLELLPDCDEATETYVLCYAYRKKYLTDQQRENFKRDKIAGHITFRNEHRARAFGNFVNSVPAHYYHNGITCYVTINPRSVKGAMGKMANAIIDHLAHGQDQYFDMPRKADSFITSTRGTKNFLDIDIDYASEEQEDLVQGFITSLEDLGCKLQRVFTYGGSHLVVARESLPKGFHLKQSLDLLKDTLNSVSLSGTDVMVNTNDLVPLVGTRQNNFLITT